MYVHPADTLIQTVRIECKLSNHEISVGTGFHYRFLVKEIKKDKKIWGIPAIVTNKHVIKNSISGNFFMNSRDDNGNCIYGKKIQFNFSGEDWIPHPDPDVDLAMLHIGPQITEVEKKGGRVFLAHDYYALIPSYEKWMMLSPFEDVVMVGFPNGLWDESNNLPISRRGITATHPKLNYMGKQEFLIDLPVFPGTSGAPVFTYSYGIEFLPSGGISHGGKCLFLGILYAVLKYRTNKSGAVTQYIPTHNKPRMTYKLLSNLGAVIKSTRLREFEPILEERMNDIDRKYYNSL